MTPGDVFAQRFEIQSAAGAGGTSTIYRAVDRTTGGLVALKVLHRSSEADAAALMREGALLAGLDHPCIVRHVAHGRTHDGAAFLAMEWLEGHDLAAAIKRAPLPLEDTLRLFKRVAQAVAHVHERGVVHLDLKPNNLFLIGGRIEGVRLLDFGIARRLSELSGGKKDEITAGTLGYMAPEQMTGDRSPDRTADVFALGCVVFKCLTGRRVFEGEDPSAIMCKTLFEEAPPLSEFLPEAPEALDALLRQMLAKKPEERLPHGAAVYESVRSLALLAGEPSLMRRPPPPAALTEREQRLVCVVLASLAPPPNAFAAATVPDAMNLPEPEGHEPTFFEETTGRWSARRPPDLEPRLRAAVEPFGARTEVLVNGTAVVTLTGKGGDNATDLAARAARCALALRAVEPMAPIALATGRAVLSDRLPVGEVIDRAASLLKSTLARHMASVVSGQGTPPVRINDVTAGLLGAQFEVGGDDRGLFVRGERERAEAARTLLGKKTPCVGRDAEVADLVETFEQCVKRSSARAVLVTAPAGGGKTRLRQEFLRHVLLRRRGVAIWSAQGDPTRANAPFSLISQIVRAEAGIAIGEPLSVRRSKLRARVGRHVTGERAPRVAEFLGEVVGTPFETDESVQLRAAREDTTLRGDQMRRAWEDFLGAECAAQPVLIVLDDMHWGDVPSAIFLDHSLRRLRDRPWMVVAFARPEVDAALPALWADRDVRRSALAPLGEQASQRLVRAALGERATPELSATLSARAGGNPFCLEELIRAAAEGTLSRAPETVLAMAQSRLTALGDAARRVLRAGSVFGDAFWAEGVGALLGEHADTVRACCEELCAAEVLLRGANPKYAGQDEYAFGQGILREAAYAMLTDQDRALGHRLAAAWLESAGESDATVLAEHFERGGEPERAMRFYLRATEAALAGNDLDAVPARVARAVACGAAGETLGMLRLLEAEAHKWRGAQAEAERCALEAMQRLPRASVPWFAAAGECAVAASRAGHAAQLKAVAGELVSVPTHDETAGAHIAAMSRAAARFLYAGQFEQADKLFRKIDRLASPRTAQDPAVSARLQQARALQCLFSGDPVSHLALMEASAQNFERAGDLRNACAMQVEVGYGHLELGAFPQARKGLEGALESAQRMGLLNTAASARSYLAVTLAALGDPERARDMEAAAADAFRLQGSVRMEGGARMYLAEICLTVGDLAEAESQARRAVELLGVAPPLRLQALAVLVRILLERRSLTEATQLAEGIEKQLHGLGDSCEGESMVRLACAETWHAAGQRERAVAAINAARESVTARAALITDETLRQCFVNNVPANARTLGLSRSWTGEESDWEELETLLG